VRRHLILHFPSKEPRGWAELERRRKRGRKIVAKARYRNDPEPGDLIAMRSPSDRGRCWAGRNGVWPQWFPGHVGDCHFSATRPVEDELTEASVGANTSLRSRQALRLPDQKFAMPKPGELGVIFSDRPVRIGWPTGLGPSRSGGQR